jgi:cytochrome c-type biogenesis protein CcmE
MNKTFPIDKRIKLGGMVLNGSVKRASSNISFIVTDYTNSINVEYEGILPDLFKEDSGVVVLGYLNNQTVYAEEVLAKHDENYMPPNIEVINDN